MKITQVTNADGTTATTQATSGTASGEFSSYLDEATGTTNTTLEAIFKKASKTYGVSEDLLKSMAKAESNFQSDATSSSGAMGIMQLMPSTAEFLGVTDAYDPEQNIMGGAKYISSLLDKYNGNVSYALAAYNAGSGNVDKYGGVPPFKETQNYVTKILGYMKDGVEIPSDSNNVTTSESEDTTLEDIRTQLQQLFSYDDYLDFMKLFLENAVTQMQTGSTQQTEETQQQDSSSDAYVAFQNMKNQNMMSVYLKPSGSTEV